MTKEIQEHLGNQFKKASPILFTGAGFSLSAKGINGRNLPTGFALAERLWALAFPGEQYDRSMALQDVYQVALKHKRKEIVDEFRGWFTVDATQLPEHYRLWFSMPWYRVFTLNVDDLPLAAARAWDLPRTIKCRSGVAPPSAPSDRDSSDTLEVIQLHGTLDDVPDRVTFGRGQYAARAGQQDPWYALLSAELIQRPTVFVGTPLEEPIFWQHIELRGLHGKRSELNELRPKSYLVSPALDKAREKMLAEYNVIWVKMTGEEFAVSILGRLGVAMNAGLKRLDAAEAKRTKAARVLPVPDAAELIRKDVRKTKSRFLLGDEPHWYDITEHNAVTRQVDEALNDLVDRTLASSGVPNVIAIVGTAGSGKSTTLRRQVIRLIAKGLRVSFIGRDDDFKLSELTKRLGGEVPKYNVVAVDDADRFGNDLAASLNDLASRHPNILPIVALRSTKLDRVLSSGRLDSRGVSDLKMPHLEDSDIDDLLEKLAAANLLGALRGKTRPEQVKAFKEKCGRQLVVAMYEATSGQPFREKVVGEYTELIPPSREIYGMIAVAYSLGFALEREELLIAINNANNETLNAIQRLQELGIVIPNSDGTGVRARHKFIAEQIQQYLQEQRVLGRFIQRLAFAASTRVRDHMRRSDRAWRLLKYLVNNEFLYRTTSVDEARGVYGEIENQMQWDYQFWLQRGLLEVKEGILALAENYLNQAYSLEPNDSYVVTSMAYLQFRKAIERPHATDAPALVKQAKDTLLAQIVARGRTDHYPFHLLGAKGLSWSRQAPLMHEDRLSFLHEIESVLAKGVTLHPNEKELVELFRDVKREIFHVKNVG